LERSESGEVVDRKADARESGIESLKKRDCRLVAIRGAFLQMGQQKGKFLNVIQENSYRASQFMRQPCRALFRQP